MRRASILLGLLLGCHHDPNCKDGVTTAAARFGNADIPAVATVIGTCDQEAWSSELRGCFARAETAAALEACMPAIDVKVPAFTIAPSTATNEVLAPNREPITALLFFDDPNGPLGKTVTGYFAALGLKTEVHDRLANPTLAERYKVATQGVVLVRGEKSQQISFGSNEDLASGKLGTFDREIAVMLAKLMRPPRRAYVAVGHGEMTDPGSLPPELVGRAFERKTTTLMKQLRELDYEVKALDVITLLADVPADATVVLLLAPAAALLPTEWDSLERYLDRGGSLLVALDPTTVPELGPLEAKLGVHFNGAHVVDDKAFFPSTRT